MNDTLAMPDAERALIGCLLSMTVTTAHEVLDALELEDLSVPQLRLVVEAIRALVDQGTHPDPIAVLGQIRRTGHDSSLVAGQSVGPFLADLTAAAPHVGSHGHYLQIVLEHSWRRRVRQAGERLQQAAGAAALADLEQTLALEVSELRAWSLRWRAIAGEPPVVPLHGISA